MDEKARRGIPPRVAIALLIAGAVCCLLFGFATIGGNVIMYLACGLNDGGPDAYCSDGTWSAGRSIGTGFIVFVAGILMLVRANLMRKSKQSLEMATPPPPPPPPQVVASIEWTCPNCKGAIGFASKFCLNCGRAVDGALAQDS